MSEEKTTIDRKNKARRKLLKGIVASGGALTAGNALPENWARPVVEAVSLPAHAQTTSTSLQDLSPFESGEQSFGYYDLNDAGERFAALDAPVETADWDKLSDTEILDFFARPAHAGGHVNASSFYLMFAEGHGSTGSLCVTGEFNSEYFEAILFNTPVEGNIIKGGPASDVFGVNDAAFSDFTLNGNLLTGSFDLIKSNATSATDISVVLTPGGPGCSLKV